MRHLPRIAALMLRTGLFAVAACDSTHAPIDAVAMADAIPASRFACNLTSCDRATEFCYHQAAGVAPAMSDCNPIPAACSGAATCECILANTTTPCGASTTCQLDGDAVTLVCQLP